MSRIANGIKNTKISIIFSLLTFFISFYARAVFIDYLGDALVGLTSTMMNILGFLNLAELGLTSAISGTLYKPLFAKDKEGVEDIISIFGYLYRIIGFSILGMGIILSLFLPFFFKDEMVRMIDVYGSFYTYLSTSLIGYFISYRQTLLIADQKEYVVTSLTNISLILKLIFQIVVLKYLHGSYLEWLLIELFFGIIYGFWINTRLHKHYPDLKTDITRGKNVLKKYKGLFRTIKQVIPHQIGAFVLSQTDNILIYSFSSLAMVTLYTNYTLILNKLSQYVKMAFNGTMASIGNLVAEGNKERILHVFNEYNSLFFFIGGVSFLCLYYLLEPFVTLWVGVEYIMDKTILYLLLLNTYIALTRIPVSFFIGGYVLYKDTWAPLAEASINLIISMIVGYYFGIFGVVLGTTVSLLLIIVLWKPYFLFREGLKENIWKYWQNVIKYILLLCLTWVIIQYLSKTNLFFSNINFFWFTLNSIIMALCCSLIYGGLMLLFDKGTKDLLKRIVYILRRRHE